jgi:tRNA (uracil-5-)-methyltransferase
MIGFRLGDYKSGSNEVVSPESCKNISNEMKILVNYFQKYIDEVSKYKAFNVRNHEGFWRQLTLRSNQKNDILALIVLDKKNLTDVRIIESN